MMFTLNSRTIALPQSVIYDFDPGWVHGNQMTCTITGFSAAAFYPIRTIFNTMLAVYYVFAINFKKRDAEVKKTMYLQWWFPSLASFLPLRCRYWDFWRGLLVQIHFIRGVLSFRSVSILLSR